VEWLILGIVVALTVINVPIGFALSISAIILLIWKGTASLSVVPLNLFSGASSFPLLAIPLFILAGGLMETSGISLRLVNLANSFVGFIRGGLAMVTVVATMIQSEISGSSVADAAAIGNVVIPAMEKRGYPRALSAAIVTPPQRRTSAGPRAPVVTGMGPEVPAPRSRAWSLGPRRRFTGRTHSSTVRPSGDIKALAPLTRYALLVSSVQLDGDRDSGGITAPPGTDGGRVPGTLHRLVMGMYQSLRATEDGCSVVPLAGSGCWPPATWRARRQGPGRVGRA